MYPFPEMPKESDAEHLAEKLLFLEEEIASSFTKRILKRKLYISSIEEIKNEFLLLKSKSTGSEIVLLDEYINYCSNISRLLWAGENRGTIALERG